MSAKMARDDKVATAHRLYDALATGDRDALATLLAPDFIGHAAEGMPLNMGGEHRGPEAMRANLWWRIGEHFKARAHPVSFDLLEDGRLAVSGHYQGAGRRSGKPLDAAFIHYLSFGPDGRIQTLEQLTDTAKWHAALDDAGQLHRIDYHVEHGVAHVCLNRPDQQNAIDLQMGRETVQVAERIAADRAIRAVLICGNGPALSVGEDIGCFLDGAQERLGDRFFEMASLFHRAFEILSGIDAPIVTAAHGAVAGAGLGYVYCADIVLAAEDTKFVTAFAGIGLSGDGGGTWHLPRLIGPRRAAAAYLRNTPITAAEALDWGLVNEIVPADQLRSCANELARELASGPAVAFATMRQLLQQSWRNDLSVQLAAEARGMQRTGNSDDAVGAIAAFAAKTRSEFNGR